MTTTVVWMRSEYDRRLHAFDPDKIGSEFAEALCDHSAPVKCLQRTETGTRCYACLLLHGADLADNQGEAAKWAH
ncbi:MAG TPA: hypothetical protein VFV67_34205 [Actinophytocola sp.]|uniref:hypothetical protein n=1 Tax=Actinophytocola sp. TaxID=1872138 RepID=UPI002DBFFEC7|nr:hypothetical protein [Actinophytocola sp.]HEU5475722.1 hypothetical protein [Actinophytocola sp.]